jgi:hypothetical protein
VGFILMIGVANCRGLALLLLADGIAMAFIGPLAVAALLTAILALIAWRLETDG